MKYPLATRMARSRFTERAVRVVHGVHVATPPTVHADPFDRLLVAQTQIEGMTMLTRDPLIRRYTVPVIVA